MAESTNDVLIRFRTESGNLKAEMDQIENDLKNVDNAGKKAGQSVVDTNKKITDSANKASTAVKGTSNEIAKQNKIIEGLGNQFKNLGAIILAAFSVHQVIAFGEASFEAFIDAEKVAKKLQTAVGVNGGLQADFEALTKQAIELQKVSIFSDEQIKGAQTAALQFGLTNKQVEQLIPTIIDFASATGQSLDSALEAVLRGSEGMARGLKVYGVQVDSAGTKSEKLASITQQLNEKFSGQAKIIGETTFGSVQKLKNEFNDFQEGIGGFVANVGEATASLILWVSNGFKPLDSQIDKTEVKLDRIGRKINQAFNSDLLRAQLAQLRAAPEGNTEAIKQLEETLKTFNADKFVAEIERLSDAEVIKKVKDLNKVIGVTFDSLNKSSEKRADEQRKNAEDTIKDETQLAAKLKEIDDNLTEEKQKNAEKVFEANKKTLGTITRPEDLNDQEKLDILNQIVEKRRIENKLLDDQNQLSDSVLAKAKQEQEERKKSTEELRKFTLKTLQDNITDEFAARRKDAADTIKDRETLDTVLAQLDLQELEARKQLLIDFLEATSDVNKQIVDKQIALNNQLSELNKKNLKEDLEATLATIDSSTSSQLLALQEQFSKTGDFSKQATDKLAKEKLEIEVGAEVAKNREIINSSISTDKEKLDAQKALNDALAKLYAADVDEFQNNQDKKKETIGEILGFIQNATNEIAKLSDSQNQIDEINKVKDARLEAIDEEIQAAEEKNNRGRISDEALEKKKKELIAQRTAAEKAADREVRAIKRKQAETDKQLAIFNIVLNTAVAIVKALPNVILAALAGALGAVQLGVAIATPIPAFERGTKKKTTSGLARVGERGEEIVWMPEGSKVLPNKQTQQNAAFLDAMFDNRLEKYVYDNYVIPALKKQKETNVVVNINEKKLAKAISEGQNDSVRISNLHELAQYMQPNLRRVI